MASKFVLDVRSWSDLTRPNITHYKLQSVSCNRVDEWIYNLTVRLIWFHILLTFHYECFCYFLLLCQSGRHQAPWVPVQPQWMRFSSCKNVFLWSVKSVFSSLERIYFYFVIDTYGSADDAHSGALFRDYPRYYQSLVLTFILGFCTCTLIPQTCSWRFCLCLLGKKLRFFKCKSRDIFIILQDIFLSHSTVTDYGRSIPLRALHFFILMPNQRILFRDTLRFVYNLISQQLD